MSCRHPLCELIGGPCSLASGRSRGCTPGLAAKQTAPEVFDELRRLVAAIAPTEQGRAAAARLAEIVRREARDDRNVIVQARDEEPELATALARLCLRP